jgi:hypothetical protein
MMVVLMMVERMCAYIYIYIYILGVVVEEEEEEERAVMMVAQCLVI